MEHGQRAGRHFQRLHVGVARRWPRPVVQRQHVHSGAIALEALAQRAAVAAGLQPQAAVVQRGIFQREPEGGHAEQAVVHKAGVLVPLHLTTDAGLLEDQHRLPQHGLLQAQVMGQFGQLGPARELVEHRVQVVQRMADLVDRQGLGLAQPAPRVESLFFEEALNAFGRGQKGRIGAAPGLVLGREHAAVGAGIEVGHDLLATGHQGLDLLVRLEPRQQQEALLSELVLLMAAEHGPMMPAPVRRRPGICRSAAVARIDFSGNPRYKKRTP